MTRQETQKKSIVSCIKNFKFCNTKTINKDYECLPYEAPSAPSSKMTTPVRKQIIQNRCKLAHLNRLIKQTTKCSLFKEQPDFQSTQIIEYVNQVKTSSTFINRNQVPIENSLSLSHISNKSLTNSSSDYDSPPSESTRSSSFNYESSQCSESPIEFQTLYSSTQFEDIIYVCTMPYQARFEGDLSLKYTDRVRVLHATEDFALVKKINGSEECGYVSTRCLISLTEFLKRL